MGKGLLPQLLNENTGVPRGVPARFPLRGLHRGLSTAAGRHRSAASGRRNVYFPMGAVLSLLTSLKNGTNVETANIGNEGAFGLFAAMYSRTSFNQCLVQLEGRLVRVPIEVVLGEFERSEHVRNLLVSYSETLLSQVQQTVACNARHVIEQRLCRWLLMMHDRAGREELSYTHEFLAHMLGADRKSVTLAAQAMQAAGLIGYRMGTIQIANRPGLEKAACECYAVVQARFDAFLTPPATAVQNHTGGRVHTG